MERERKREGSSDEEKEFEVEVEVEEEMNKRKWWKRAVSLAMRRETVEANTPRSGRHIVRNGTTVASFFDRLVIHPDNWYNSLLFFFFEFLFKNIINFILIII